jgi:hypothetical protein
MSKYVFLLVVIWSLQSCSMRNPEAEDFRKKIIKSFASVKKFTFLNKNNIVYIDTAFGLPQPVFKAMVVDGEAPNDSVFFYYYLAKDIQRVFQFRLSNTEFHVGSQLLDCGNMLADSTTGNFLLYFRNCPPVEEMILDLGEASSLDSSLSTNFGFKSPKITVEEVRQEEEVPEPPPPPPPKPKK